MEKAPINILSTRKIDQRDLPLLFQSGGFTYRAVDYGRRGFVPGGFSVVVRSSSGQVMELMQDDSSQRWYVARIVQNRTFA